MQESLYEKCIKRENIVKAIKEINRHSGSKTPGPDGITSLSKIPEAEAVRQVKLRLRRYKRVNSRQVEIPKRDGKRRRLTVINLYDRYAQQAVYRVIAPIVEPKMSKHSYGFRKGISAKIPASKVANFIMNSSEIWTVEIDFEKCFDNIPLTKALESLRKLGIKESKILITIKHLMYTSKEYSGVGLGQGTILGPMLCNCYLDKLDRFIEREFEIEKSDIHKNRDYTIHKNEWIEWLKKREKKVVCRYFRFADDSIVLTKFKEEQEYIWNKIIKFIDEEMQIEVNLAKSKRRKNRTDFLGFHYIKSEGIWIKVKNEKEIIENAIKTIGKGTPRELIKFKRYIVGVLNYFDIVNDMREILQCISYKLYNLARKGLIKEIEGKENSYYKSGKYSINIWGLRKVSRLSYKEYTMGSSWIREREKIVTDLKEEEEWTMFKWNLFTRQRGKDIITGKSLEVNDCNIHHVIPKSKGGSNEIENLILISSETHKRLHYGGELPKKAEKYRKYLS